LASPVKQDFRFCIALLRAQRPSSASFECASRNGACPAVTAFLHITDTNYAARSRELGATVHRRSMDASVERKLDPGRRSLESRDFEAGLRRKIVGQDEAVQAVVDLCQVLRAGLNSPGRPVGNLLFRGPTGAVPFSPPCARTPLHAR
jgi:hypothetical protein